MKIRDQLIKEFAEVINRNSLENYTETPDFILAEYIVNCLENYEILHNQRKKMARNKTNSLALPQKSRRNK